MLKTCFLLHTLTITATDLPRNSISVFCVIIQQHSRQNGLWLQPWSSLHLMLPRMRVG